MSEARGSVGGVERHIDQTLSRLFSSNVINPLLVRTVEESSVTIPCLLMNLINVSNKTEARKLI